MPKKKEDPEVLTKFRIYHMPIYFTNPPKFHMRITSDQLVNVYEFIFIYKPRCIA